MPPRGVATAAAFPTGNRAGARPPVQHRRRVRRGRSDSLSRTEPASLATVAARAAAEALFGPC